MMASVTRPALFLAAVASLLVAALAGRAQARPSGPDLFYPGAGGAAHRALDESGVFQEYGVAPAEIVVYHEPYIGRGLVYNTPPDPFVIRRQTVIRARY